MARMLDVPLASYPTCCCEYKEFNEQTFTHFSLLHIAFFTHGSRVNIAISGLCDATCDSVSLSVCTIEPKRLEVKSPNSAQESPSRYIGHQLISGQKVKGQGHRVKRCATPCRSGVTPLNETAPHGRRELCTLSSAQHLVV